MRFIVYPSIPTRPPQDRIDITVEFHGSRARCADGNIANPFVKRHDVFEPGGKFRRCNENASSCNREGFCRSSIAKSDCRGHRAVGSVVVPEVVVGESRDRFAVLCNVGVTKPAKYEKSDRRVGAQLAQRHLHPEKMTAVQGDWSLARAADRSRTRINDQFERRSGLVWNSGPLWIAPFRKTFWLRNRPRI